MVSTTCKSRFPSQTGSGRSNFLFFSTSFLLGKGSAVLSLLHPTSAPLFKMRHVASRLRVMANEALSRNPKTKANRRLPELLNSRR
jgi:hypothetical protein